MELLVSAGRETGCCGLCKSDSRNSGTGVEQDDPRSTSVTGVEPLHILMNDTRDVGFHGGWALHEALNLLVPRDSLNAGARAVSNTSPQSSELLAPAIAFVPTMEALAWRPCRGTARSSTPGQSPS